MANETPDGTKADDIQESELVDLGAAALPKRLDVAPGPVGQGRRPGARIALIAAGAIVAFAVLGSGPLAPTPPPTTSPSDSPPAVVEASPPPASADPCPAGPPDPPTVGIAPRGVTAARSTPARTVADPRGAGFDVPVDRSVEIPPGSKMHVQISDVRCVDLVGIDVADAGRPFGDGLTVRAPAPLAGGARFVNWQGPPAGDWTVRVAVRLRGLGASAALTPWSVYYFRLNSGFVAYASPLPDGLPDPGGRVDGPLVTPTKACGSPSATDDVPPAADLVSGAIAHPGVRGDYTWRGSTVRVAARDALASAAEVTIDGPLAISLAGAVCATSWRIDVGWLTAGEPALEVVTTLDQSPDNPTNDLLIAAQNEFASPMTAYGTYVLAAMFTFPNGDSETLYWMVQAPTPSLPGAWISMEAAGEGVRLARGCGATITFPDGAYGSEVCSPTWPRPDGPVLSVPDGTLFRVRGDEGPLTGWSVGFVDQASIGPNGAEHDVVCDLISGWSSVGLRSVEVPAPPVGDWVLRVGLAFREGDLSMWVTYYVRIEVTADSASPGASGPSCPSVDVVY